MLASNLEVSKVKNKENNCLWMLKGIACILVILFHCPIQGIIGDGIIYGLRFPIPIFLMISGYYSLGKDTYMQSAVKTLRLLIFGELVTAIAMEINFLVGASNVKPLERLSQINLIKVLCFGTIFNGTLWYLYAMFWGWVLFYIASKFTYGFLILKCSIIPLLATHVLARMLVTRYSDINEKVFLFRSTILFVVPFFMIGRFIAEHEKVLMRMLSNMKNLVLILIGVFLIVIEYIIWKQFMDLQISTIFVSIGLFLFALQNPEFTPSKFLIKIGHISQYMYLFHIPISILVKPVLLKILSERETASVFPYLVIISTIFASYSYIWLIKKKGLKKLWSFCTR